MCRGQQYQFCRQNDHQVGRHAVEFGCHGVRGIPGVTQSISKCNTIDNTTFVSRTIRKIDGLPTNTVLDVCGEQSAPNGWVFTAVTGTCSRVDNTTFIGRRIRKIEGLAPGATVEICGQLAPAGWITTKISTCGKVDLTTYIMRTITRYEGLPVGSALYACGDAVPTGWVATTANSKCATINNSTFSGRAILKIENRGGRSGENLGGGNDETNVTLETIAETSEDGLLAGYPNPVMDVLTVRYHLQESQFATLKIVDVNGMSRQVVAPSLHEPGVYTLTYDCSSLPPGVYMLSLETRKERVLKRFVKE